MYAVLPSRIEPGFGYIYVYRPNQCTSPNQGFPALTQPDLGSSQAGPTMWHAPLGRAPQGSRPPLATPTLSRSSTPRGGGGQGGGMGVPWAAQTLLLLRVGVVLEAGPD